MSGAYVRRFVGGWLCVASLVCVTSLYAADEAATAKRAKPRGRLPAHYAQIIDGIQRQKIYDLQAKYQSRIDELTAELKKIEGERDKEIESLLTDEQRQRLTALRAEAEAKREAMAANKKKAPAAASIITPAVSK